MDIKENGHINYADTTLLISIHHMLYDLLQAGLISKVHESHFRTSADNRTEAERITQPVEEYKASKKAEREAMWEATIQKMLVEWKYGDAAEMAEIVQLRKGTKRPLEDSEDGGSHKRSRPDLSSADVARAEDRSHNSIAHAGYFSVGFGFHLHDWDADRGQDEIVFRANRDKLAALCRTNHLIELAEQTISKDTSKTYEQVLHIIESRVRECRNTKQSVGFDRFNDSSLTHITTKAIAAAIPESSDLMNHLGTIANDQLDGELDHPKKRRRKSAEEKSGPIDVDDEGGEGDADEHEDGSSDDSDGINSATSDDEDENMADAEYDPLNKGFAHSPHHDAVRSHLLLLAQHPIGFLRHIPRSFQELESWTVSFPDLIRRSQCRTIAQTVIARYGAPSARLMNILSERGKLDEKTLSSLSLIREKEMRSRLSTMQKAGLLELQEVPRDNARVASRTNFLFFYDHDRCKRNLLEECYKALSRLLERARVEKEKVKGTLEKASRSDVKGKEKQLLSIAELNAWNQWKSNEAKIWGQIGRIDDMVALLRDF